MGLFRKIGNFLTFGALDRRDAKRITRDAKRREEDAREELEEQKDKTQNSLENLGNLKQRFTQKQCLTLQKFIVE